MKHLKIFTLGIATLAILVSVGVQTAHASVLTTLAGRDLSVGSRGFDVVDLQAVLSELGYLNVPQGVPFGYFGPLTQAALARYQVDLGVTPAIGYFGAETKERIIANFTARNWIAILQRENF